VTDGAPTAGPPPLVEWRPGVRTRLHAARTTGAESLCALEQLSEPGRGAPLHRHAGVEEVIVVLEGRARFQVDERAVEVGPGESILLAPGCLHGFTNIGEGTLRTLAFLPAAAPPVQYEGEDDVLEIGGGGADRRDAHRAYPARGG
jgi:quercetin dioxygenase-like cupin family protein